jgi:hypothetical protein
LVKLFENYPVKGNYKHAQNRKFNNRNAKKYRKSEASADKEVPFCTEKRFGIVLVVKLLMKSMILAIVL